MKNLTIRTALVVVLLLSAAALPAQQFDFLKIGAFGDHILFETKVAHDGLDLRVGGPDGLMIRQSDALFRTTDDEGKPLPDGTYVWELRLAPVLSDAERAELQSLRGIDDGAVAARLAGRGHSASGAFSILNGSLVDPDLEEIFERADPPVDANVLPTKDIVQLDDVIITFSLCVGNDCVNGESFGFDTLRLKENNIRIHFEDTSSTGAFPTNDWRIAINDTANGGSNHFSVEDSTGGRVPFRIEAGAPADALVVEADGDIGVKTQNPAVNIHVVEGDSPTLRLEQDGSSGFTPQTYDIAANEANFFIRDVTNGSKLFFRAKPDAPADSIFVAVDGDIGLGTDSPAQSLHVNGFASGNVDGDVVIAGGTSGRLGIRTANPVGPFHVENDRTINTDDVVITSLGNVGMGVEIPQEELHISRAAPVVVRLENTAAANLGWDFGAFTSGNFIISDPGDGNAEFTMDSSGNVLLSGTITAPSDVRMKENFADADGVEILRKVADLPITFWNYKHTPAATHVGPTAQDFYAAFGLGGHELGIQPTNLASVALSAVQGLNEVVEQKDAEIDELKARLAALEALVEKLASEH